MGRAPNRKPRPVADPERLRRAIEEALPIARERGRLHGELREALLAGQDQAALALARRLCGLPPLEAT